MSALSRLRLAADVALACVGAVYVVAVCLTGRGRLPMMPGHSFNSGRWWAPPPAPPKSKNPAC